MYRVASSTGARPLFAVIAAVATFVTTACSPVAPNTSRGAVLPEPAGDDR